MVENPNDQEWVDGIIKIDMENIREEMMGIILNDTNTRRSTSSRT
jgi:hypothetical protein